MTRRDLNLLLDLLGALYEECDEAEMRDRISYVRNYVDDREETTYQKEKPQP